MKYIFAAAVTATFLAGCAGMGGGQGATSGTASPRSAGQMVDDATITARVNTQLAADPDLSALKINVDTVQGVVRLKGEVKSLALRRKAESLAQGIPGVKRVDNQLVITG